MNRLAYHDAIGRNRRGGVASLERVGAANAYGFKGVRQYHIALLWSAGVRRVALL